MILVVSRDFGLRSGGDPRARRDPQEAARPPRRVPHEGRARRRSLYVGKAQSLRSRVRSYWQKQAVGRRGPPDPRASSTGSPTSSTRMTDSVSRGAPARGQPRSSAIGRGSTSGSRTTRATRTSRSRWPTTSRGSSGRASCPTTAAATSGRTPRRRSVDESMNLDPPAVPVPDLHDRHQGRRAGAPAAVPAVPHQALPGPVHRGDLQGRLPGRHRPGRAVPRGPPGDAGQGARRRT